MISTVRFTIAALIAPLVVLLPFVALWTGVRSISGSHQIDGSLIGEMILTGAIRFYPIAILVGTPIIIYLISKNIFSIKNSIYTGVFVTLILSTIGFLFLDLEPSINIFAFLTITVILAVLGSVMGAVFYLLTFAGNKNADTAV